MKRKAKDGNEQYIPGLNSNYDRKSRKKYPNNNYW